MRLNFGSYIWTAVLTFLTTFATTSLVEHLRDTPRCAKPMIKGNISPNGAKIYHVPGARYYDKTIIEGNERMFCTEEDAVKSGWRKSKL